MKKIVMGMAALACAASMFAADVSSKVQMKADVVRKAGDAVEFFALNENNQKDNDALIFSVAGDKAGATWQVWYLYDGTNGENTYTEEDKGVLSGNSWEVGQSAKVHGLRIRNVSLWFKPADPVKVTIGDTNLDSYKEHIFWWHGVYGAKPGSWGGFGGEYIAGSGFKVEYTPIAGLNLTAALLPGVGGSFLSTKEDAKVAKFGVKAQYALSDIPMTMAGVFTMDGDNKTIAVGADYGNEWGGNFYAFCNLNFKLGKDGLTGLSVDNAEYFTVDALKIQTHLPFVMYKENDKMKAGMYATVKATYAINGYSPYLLITTEPDGDSGWCFDAFKFDLTIQPGVTFNIGSCGMEAAFRIDIRDSKVTDWKLPVTMTVNF